MAVPNNGKDRGHSPIDFDEFKCSQCQKYLSVSPIYVHTDQNGEDRNICGRCRLPQAGRSVRNISFEALAKYQKFPCSISKSCTEILPWGEAAKHEINCIYRNIACSICHTSYTAPNVITHYKRNHPENVFFNKTVTISEDNVFYHTYPSTCLVVYPTIISLVHIKVDTTLTIQVEQVFASSRPHFFNVTFSTRNDIISFQNRQIRLCKDWLLPLRWKEYQFELVPILDTITLDTSDTSEFKIELELYEEKHLKNETPCAGGSSDNRVNQEASALMKRRMTIALECPTCFEVMTSNIFVCKTGHSICEKCRELVTICPTCRDGFEGTRNFALEEVTRQLEHL